MAGMNEVQRQAALWEEGPLLVLAGPGSGKTRVLTCRIARLLEDSPDQSFRILALTFTNKAADEMRERVDTLVPGQSHRLFIGTFHSFCAEVLRTHGSHIGIRPDFRIYSARQDLEAIVAEVIRSQGGRWRTELSSLVGTLERLRGDLVRPEEVSRLYPPPHGSAMEALYRGYEQKLRELNAMDFGSMLYGAHELFSRFPAMARHYRKVYPHWCIDEFQDTNSAQYRLLRTMAGEGFRNLFVVADDDQVLYEWNGASHRRLTEFREHFQPVVLQLSTNYRCPGPILELANRLIRHNYSRTPGKEPLQAGRVCENGPVRVRLQRCVSDVGEAEWIAQDVLERKVSCSETAILARNRALLEKVLTALTEAGIPATLAQRRDEFGSPHFRWLQGCLHQDVYRTDPRNLVSMVGTFALLTDSTVTPEDVMNRAGATHGDLLRAWTELCREEAPDIVPLVQDLLLESQDFRKFVASALEWLASRPPHPDYDEDLAAWTELWRDISNTMGPGARLSAFLQELELRSKAPAPDPSAVRLMTIHASKGLEFPHVYVAGLADEILPSYQALKAGASSPQLEEERRNCFVAVTRTQETLTLTYADTYRGYRKNPSRFLYEMGLL